MVSDDSVCSALAKFVLQYRSRKGEDLIWQYARHHWFKDKGSHKCITRAAQKSGEGECARAGGNAKLKPRRILHNSSILLKCGPQLPDSAGLYPGA